ncbi:protein YqhG of unknown function [Seinonella peptonophila]|uniref:Uncharacterized protein n=1 Tax=Seinonella peptonophila TaxID=112248 RepID=A0A1M4TPF4_9BACL|nr:YqhG family protein [Seinonella peptonophila]SHE46399.1 protein YqhG of unknown function [Seinonella peptonophila]
MSNKVVTEVARNFIERYLYAYDCQIIESTPSYLHTQLSIPADRDLCNRPYYWMYVEQLNLPPQPIQLCLTFDPEHPPTDRPSEWIFPGSQRYQHFLQSAKRHGRFTSLFQNADENYRRQGSYPYQTWLGINFLVSYICEQKRDQIWELGINLQSGEIVESFYQQIKSLSWQTQLPPNRFTQPLKLKYIEALGELECYLEEKISLEDHDWAKQALTRLSEEQEQLQDYYPESQSNEEVLLEKKQRNLQLVRQYHPRIEVEVINGGFFHLDMLKYK